MYFSSFISSTSLMQYADLLGQEVMVHYSKSIKKVRLIKETEAEIVVVCIKEPKQSELTILKSEINSLNAINKNKRMKLDSEIGPAYDPTKALNTDIFRTYEMDDK